MNEDHLTIIEAWPKLPPILSIHHSYFFPFFNWSQLQTYYSYYRERVNFCHDLRLHIYNYEHATAPLYLAFISHVPSPTHQHFHKYFLALLAHPHFIDRCFTVW
jgi:hypothetical protein